MIGPLALLMAPLGGYLYRMRGGLHGDWIRAHLWAGYGTQGGRALFALATAGFCCLLAPELLRAGGMALKSDWRLTYGLVDGAKMIIGLGAAGEPSAIILPLWLWLAGAVFAGLVMGWMHSADLGRDKDRPRLVEALIMSARGLLMTAPAGALLWALGRGPWFILTGAALGLLYELGHRTPSSRPDFHQGMEIAEVYTGTWLWLSLGLALV